jgi:hypothetical protein
LKRVALLLLTLTACAPTEPAPDFAQTAWVGSAVCAECHQDRHASWSRTFHRTMTQPANSDSVVGRFDGQPIALNGGAVRPVARDGGYFFEYLDPNDGRLLGAIAIEKTVGSHRYQQYLGKAANGGDNHYRLELLWHLAEQRWVPVTSAFFGPDGERFDAHFTAWDQNCIFCHNLGPEPRIQNFDALRARAAAGERVSFPDEARYAAQVAELGVSCENCHAPGAAHVAANRSWWRRTQLAMSGAVDPTIVNPSRIDAARSSEICAACHAQRVPASLDLVETWLDRGPTYRAGAVLAEHVTPVSIETPGPANDPHLYRLRFWADGVPRLTAYEYQGFAASRCATEDQSLRCITCHSMHAGNPAGMQTDRQSGDQPCEKCHAPIASDPVAHSGHATTQSACVDCHMPKVVYGVMAIHRSHQIEVPNLAALDVGSRPDACSACHLDWDAKRIAGESQGDGIPQQLKLLYAGDPVARAIAAERYGMRVAALSDAQKHAALRALNSSLSDPYAAVRRFAWRSMTALNDSLVPKPLDSAALARFDYAQPAQPSPFALDPPPLDPTVYAELDALGRAHAQRISVGE